MTPEQVIGAIVTGVGTLIAGVLGFVGTILTKHINRLTERVESLEGKLDDCTKEHAKARGELSGLREALRLVSEKQDPEVQEQVQAAIDNSRTYSGDGER